MLFVTCSQVDVGFDLIELVVGKLREVSLNYLGDLVEREVFSFLMAVNILVDTGDDLFFQFFVHCEDKLAILWYLANYFIHRNRYHAGSRYAQVGAPVCC